MRRSPGSCPRRPPRTPRSQRTVGTSPSTTSRSPSAAPARSPASSTSPTPSTSTPPSRRARTSCSALGSTDSLDVRRSIAAGQLARNQLALDLASTGRRGGPRWSSSDRQQTTPAATPEAASGGAARAPLRHRDHRKQRVPGAGAGGEPAPDRHRRPDPHLVRHPRHRGHREAGDRPQRTHPRRGLRSPRPAPRTSHPARPHLRVPLVHPISPEDRCRPRHPLRRGRHHQQRQHRAAVPTTSSTENPYVLDLHDARTRIVPLVEPARLPVPARPPRHRLRDRQPAT